MRKEIQTYCDACENNTYQTALFSKKVQGDNENYDDSQYYMVIQCNGCKEISFLLRTQNPNAIDEDDELYFDRNYSGDYEPDDEDFNFLRDKDYDKLPAKIRDLYDELTYTLGVEARISAGIILRTIVEAICLNQGVPGDNLYQKIRNMHARGLISTNELPILDKLREIGNLSTHEIKSLPLEKLSYAVDIVNHVLTSVFILPKINKRLKI